ncbi:LacI family DNA-binding transcriptional regulator [Tuanshanicoccus lijuaniae]|uniref:LacI family DNA-binding transcriptional regulator n=1 Tax=Aerococcaceae bacterium zg-1292 TaxID=2774330 RepID=UPI001BD8FBF2|nr:LacI family DNA-binding transcriptional regulator [Aerococcaceae bacterium zg-A91]MBS4457504.1 LacI family DNA-binding transcriptional regulator [Aerococcaceae bacterium zg-BR33]
MIKLEDIAHLAGVSKSTVSLVLNNKPGVSQRKRKEILELIEKHQYQPLRKSKKNDFSLTQHTVRLLACNSLYTFTYNFQQLPYFNELINDFIVYAPKYSIELLINSISIDNVESELSALENNQASEAIILLGTDLPEATVETILNLHDNIIVIDSCFDHINNNFIAKNNFQGAYLATKYLIEQGHTYIGYAMSKQRIRNFQERQAGFKAALKKFHLNTEDYPKLIFPAHEIAPRPELLRPNQLPTAYFCDNDSIAISLIKTLQVSGFNVPEDISIIGFDNISESKVISPELTTIDIDRQFMVNKALEKVSNVISQANGQENNTQYRINAKLIKRNSVKQI